MRNIFLKREKYPTELLLAGPVGDRHALNNLHVIFGYQNEVHGHTVDGNQKSHSQPPFGWC